MPVNEKSYENGKIYRIWSLDTDKIYIGSTCDTLSNRLCKHKSDYKSWKNGKRLFYSSFNLFEMVGIENCKIELEHNFACDSKTKLNREEGRIQRLYKDMIVNRAIAGRTMTEYHQEHKQEIKEYQKEYEQEHKQEIKERKKEYEQEHKQEIKERKKEYHQEHKQELKEKRNVKHNCECGSIYSYGDKSKHFRTTKHLNYINSQGLQTQTQNN